MAKILLTGFKPFLDNPVNPSEVICQNISMPNVITQVLSVNFNQAFLELKVTAERENPDYIIMLGLASSRKEISLEKVALNWNESKHPDESGNFVSPSKINSTHEQLAVMTEFPVNELFEYLDQKKYPVKITFSAGTYVCNNVYYKTLLAFPKLKSIFIHVPSFEEIDRPTQMKIIEDVLSFLSR